MGRRACACVCLQVEGQEEGEEEIDAMVRIAQMASEPIMAVRANVAALRDRLNAQAWDMLEGFIKRVCTTDEAAG